MNQPHEYSESNSKKPYMVLISMVLILLAAMIIASGLGAVPISPVETLRILFHGVLPSIVGPPQSAAHQQIFLAIRFPRVILAALVGAALSVSGATLQGVLRNPLADPYLIGLSSGAALGATIGIIIRKSVDFLGFSVIPIFAFFGGILSLGVVFLLASKNGKMTVTNLILAGIASSAFFSAIVSLLIVLHGDRLEEIVFWMMGGLTQATWNAVWSVSLYLVPGTVLIYLHWRAMNIMMLGESQAHYLGMNVEAVKRVLLVAATFVTAAAVSVTGLIGFVGLIVPHMFRRLVGSDHRILLPASLLGGAILMVMADALARLCLMPREIPVGVVTALTGAPFFLFLLKRQS